MTRSIFDEGLDKRDVNYVPLTPISFLERTAEVFGDLPAVIHGPKQYTWAQVRERSARLAQGLRALGVSRGVAVSVMLTNTPEMIEAHYAVPAINGVLNTLNIRLDARILAWQIHHCEARVLITDTEFSTTIAEALKILREEYARKLTVIDVTDDQYCGAGRRLGEVEYEAFLRQHAPIESFSPPADEWDAIAISYTSGTTGDPKGVVTHFRGAYLNAVSNCISWSMPKFPRYLWTLPMFHCNGWCFPWTVALLAGTHICLRRVEVTAVVKAFRDDGANHYCAAPIVHNMLVTAPPALTEGLPQNIRGLIGGSPPSLALMQGMARIGIDITHIYGLTEVYGPSSVVEKRKEWLGFSVEDQARSNARQGVRYALQEGMTLKDPISMNEVANDGVTVGEIMFKGNVVMKGYLKNPTATEEAFRGGWFHTGDLATLDKDRNVQITDRMKDVIISGGENISSVEVEEALYKHPAVMVCAVVGKPHPKWGETPAAFIELKPGATATAEDLAEHCLTFLARYKVPREIIFQEIPKTATGKIQKYALRKQISARTENNNTSRE